MMKRLRRRTRIGLALLAAAALAVASGYLYMDFEDARHDRFFRSGQSINEFLKDYGKSVEEAFAARDPGPILRHYSDDYRSPDRGRWLLGGAVTESSTAVSKLQAEGKQTFDRDDLGNELKAYLGGLTNLVDIKFKIDLIEEMEPGRRALLTVKFILDGEDRKGAFLQDRHFYRWHLVKEGAGGTDDAWRIVCDELVEGVRVAGTRRGFRELSPSAVGICYRHARDPHLNPDAPGVNLKFGVMQHAGSGVTAVDYDNDGRPDLFFADGVECRLFRNVTEKPGQPRFVDVTEKAGLAGLDRTNAAIFADLDNDGHKDLIVIRYCAPCKVFHNNGNGTFTDVTRAMGLDLNGPAMAACCLDYDRDGHVDLYVGMYGNAFEEVPRLPFYAQNGGKNRLFRNVGGHRFEDVTDASGTGDPGWTMAVAAADLNNDGWPDLVMANDFGKKSVYRNNGDGTFTEITKQAGVLDFSGGMGVAVADFDDDGLLDLYFANINSNQRWFGEDATVQQYLRNVARTRWLFKDFGEFRKLYGLLGADWRSLGKRVGKGNSLYRNNGDGTFTELADSHTTRAGWGWGVAFFDMDNDGDLDIFAANGWISNKLKDDL